MKRWQLGSEPHPLSLEIINYGGYVYVIKKSIYHYRTPRAASLVVTLLTK